MFLLSRLDQVATRFPDDIRNAREFLLDRGIPANSLDALTHFSARLSVDHAFQRDVTSLIQAVIRREHEAVDYMDLLAVLVIAATGEGPLTPTDAQEESVREILRFLTHIRPDAPAADAIPTPRASRGPAAPPFSTAPQFSSDMEPDSPWWRGRTVRAASIVALLIGLGLGWLVHSERSPDRYAATSPKSAPPSTSRENPENKEALPEAVIDRRPKALAARKPSPALSRPAIQPALPPVPQLSERVAPSRPSITSDVVQYPRMASSSPIPASPAIAPPRPRNPPPSVYVPDDPASYEPPIYTASTTAPGGRRLLPKVAETDPAPSRPSANTLESLTPAAIGIVRPGSAGMMAANLISSPVPAYPPDALQSRVQGQVTVQAIVDRDGNVSNVRVVSGPELLRSSTLEAVHRWRYRPYTQGGKAMEVATTAIMDFELP